MTATRKNTTRTPEQRAEAAARAALFAQGLSLAEVDAAMKAAATRTPPAKPVVDTSATTPPAKPVESADAAILTAARTLAALPQDAPHLLDAMIAVPGFITLCVAAVERFRSAATKQAALETAPPPAVRDVAPASGTIDAMDTAAAEEARKLAEWTAAAKERAAQQQKMDEAIRADELARAKDAWAAISPSDRMLGADGWVAVKEVARMLGMGLFGVKRGDLVAAIGAKLAPKTITPPAKPVASTMGDVSKGALPPKGKLSDLAAATREPAKASVSMEKGGSLPSSTAEVAPTTSPLFLKRTQDGIVEMSMADIVRAIGGRKDKMAIIEALVAGL